MKNYERLGLLALVLAAALALVSCGGSGSGDLARQMVMENGEYSDERFIDAMIPHHESAIEMARVAQDKSDIPEIQDLSRNIIDAQQREISQMQGWRERWYPRG